MMILSRRCRDYNTQGKKAEGKRSKRREEGCAACARARGRAEQRRPRAAFYAQALLVVVTQYSPHRRRERGPDIARVRGRKARPEASCQKSLQAWKLLPSGRGCVWDKSATMHTRMHTHTHIPEQIVTQLGEGLLLTVHHLPLLV